MERLIERLKVAERALATLKELSGIKVPSAIERASKNYDSYANLVGVAIALKG